MKKGRSDLSDTRIVELLNNSFRKNSNPSVTKLSNGTSQIVSFSRERGDITMTFIVDASFSNGKKNTSAQVQGGFAAAMLDSVCANAIVAHSGLTQTVATLEQKCSFISVVPPDTQLYATATIIKHGRKIAFLEAELRRDSKEGKLLVTCTQTCSIVTVNNNNNNPAQRSSKL